MASSSSRVVTTLAGNFGRLWKRGHESFSPNTRRILSVQGEGATAYLQGLVTCDLTQPPNPPLKEDIGVDFSDHLRAACFLDNKGRILTDSLLWKVDETHYYIDVPTETADPLLAHMKQFILRRTKVKVKDETNGKSGMSSHVIFGTLNSRNTPPGYLASVDPRHPSLGMRILSLETSKGEEFTKMMDKGGFGKCPGTYNLIRKLAGVAEGMELKGKVAAEANQEFLNAVSFSKGCYLGQELTARVHFTGAVRKRIMPIMITNINMQVPRPWLIASQIQKQQYQQQQKIKEEEDALLEELPSTSTNNNDNNSSSSKSGGSNINNPLSLSPLPRLSSSVAASMIAGMSGLPAVVAEEEEEVDDNNENNTNTKEDVLQAQTELLFNEIQTTYKVGDKIYDTTDGKTIGQIVALPEEGTNVLLAQMRLDKVGLLTPPATKKRKPKKDGVEDDDDDVDPGWKHINKISIGEASGSNPLRFLPYLPLWWPKIDSSNGKAKE
ncbi:Aminomethyltransferase folate-binding domain-containing protein [Fragilariopsis cylindrus CCMP1102]|uniref:Aminomethyltransferase folate-binding domain-containing protein n=1 Tax=Fragilariopsis cylindrus CCMP1102 TaxID=635003 RepID=A0A1E7FNH7_9STRA|nr:Aminomethyltransferase folate-binding domain-containing protein [Fragilariopsis cylindrus CCMP1102]|eukprot:OEU19697.1 Aminomethyltransferase folate-binding domain-containing protein [Fragilariopsis cylindrus CCMP1102]